jgi:NAD+-dependent protein deacetylase sirtuin 5
MAFYLSALKAQPNAAHVALAKFALSSIRDKIAPNSKFTLITQNVDGLSTRAMHSVEKEANEKSNSEIIEMHGRVHDIKCWSDKCDHITLDYTSPVCEALADTELLIERNVSGPTIPESALPRCQKCGSLARPGVVWFGEGIPELERLDDIVSRADLCIVVGTSSTVCHFPITVEAS